MSKVTTSSIVLFIRSTLYTVQEVVYSGGFRNIFTICRPNDDSVELQTHTPPPARPPTDLRPYVRIHFFSPGATTPNGGCSARRKKIGLEGMDWIGLAQERDRWRTVVNAVIQTSDSHWSGCHHLHWQMSCSRYNVGFVILKLMAAHMTIWMWSHIAVTSAVVHELSSSLLKLNIVEPSE